MQTTNNIRCYSIAREFIAEYSRSWRLAFGEQENALDDKQGRTKWRWILKEKCRANENAGKDDHLHSRGLEKSRETWVRKWVRGEKNGRAYGKAASK